MKVAIIGGGASGMMAAIMIARKGHDVFLYEKNEKLGKKLFITGKGRCNICNVATGSDFLVNIVHGEKFMMSSEARFNSADTIKFFEDLGLKIKIERGGRVFPQSDKSSDVIKCLENELKRLKVKVNLETNVLGIVIKNAKCEGIIVNNAEKTFDSVIIATGGISYPLTGSTGDGYAFAESAGHKIIAPTAALVGIKLISDEPKKLEGLSLKNVRLTVKNKQKELFVSEIGEMLFTSDGVSGPIALTASSYITRNVAGTTLEIDFKPALSFDVLRNRIDRDIIGLKAKQFSSLLEGLLPKSLVGIFSKRLHINLTKKVAQLTENDRNELCKLLKGFDYKIGGLEKIDGAIITSGGIDLKSVNPSNMKSKIVNGLQFIGEVLDVDALTGGFNLQVAWSTAVACSSIY